MQFIFTLLSSTPYLNYPYHLLGWTGWFISLCLLLWGTWHWKEPVRLSSWIQRLIVLAVFLATPFAALFLGLRVSVRSVLPVPGLPIESPVPVLMFFSAIPWVLAGGISGSVVAVLVGLLSGILASIWGTHSPFTWLETAGLALLFSVAVRQRYRTTFYKLLRHPLAAGILLSIVYAPVYILTAFFAVNGSVAVRLDYALTQTWVVMILRGVELVIACSIAELLYLTRLPFWGRTEPFKPSPAETNLQQRFFYNTAPLVLGLFLALTVSDWVVAGNAARRMISNRLSSTAQVAADSLPYFLEAGQSLIASQATPDLLDLPPELVREKLAERLRAVPYFQQLYLFGADSQLIAAFPDSRQSPVRMTEEETRGIDLALKGIPVQTYTIRPMSNASAAWMTFLALIRDAQNIPVGVLIGRTDLNSNPFTQPAIKAMESVREMGGEGFLLDEKGRILYHPVSSLVMTSYIGSIPRSESAFYDELSPTGTRRLVYYYPVTGRSWAVILSVPAEQSQQLALEIAIPLLGLVLLVSLVAYLILRLGIRTVTSSLATLAQEATLIAQGRLDHPLVVKGEDEVAQFSQAFEKMRLGLKARLEELNRLLMVSQGVAANLEMENAVRPVLQAALGGNGTAARLVLIKEVTMETKGDPFVSYGYGPSEKAYSYLDGQIFELMHQQNVLLLSNTKRTRRLTFKAGDLEPGAVLALALHHESQYYGALWVAHDHPYSFTAEEVRFLETLAGQAALAAANARLYVSAEIGRQRLEAVLYSTPEPVLVIDEWWRLLLMNPAAIQVPGLVSSAVQGRPVHEIIVHPDLLRLITASDGTVNTGEITAGGKIYFVNVSPVVANERMVGKICILQDITHFKELDSIKSDFVSTVSHDLRSPLTLVKGYVSMLQMVGQLNEQQRAYVQKILGGIENMRRLVDNLLDLGRIEAGIGLKIEQVSIQKIVQEVMNSLQPQAAQKNLQFRHEFYGEPQALEKMIIEADAALLQQALYNLVENAIKYTQVGGSVLLSVQFQTDSLLFAVRDTGIGIAPLDLPHVFEKFYRSGRREAYPHRGTGLGLAIVKSIAERHYGRVWVESRLGKGSTFYFEIPFKHTDRKN